MATRYSNVKVIGNLGERSFGVELEGQSLMGIGLKEMKRGFGERKKKTKSVSAKSKELKGYLVGEIRQKKFVLFLLVSKK